MIKLKQLLMETSGGEAPGKMEIVTTSLEKARTYAEKQFSKVGTTLDTNIPNFDINYKRAQSRATIGSTKRKDMPVINEPDVKDLQTRLSKGYIDVNEPHSRALNIKNPFPSGLSGKAADQWLKNGLKQFDNSDVDDIVKVNKKSITVNKLKPIQQQIYFDKSIDTIIKFGVSASINFIKTQLFIVSSDNFIIDGHHRYLAMMLLNPEMKVNVLSIDLPISKLLPMSLSYSDAIGNTRNQ